MTDHIVPVDIHTNPQLNFLLLTEVIRAIETEYGIDQLLQMGCDAELIDQLRHRKTRDILDISTKLTRVKLAFSPGELRQHLEGLDRQRQDDALCEYFVRNGASRALITRLFKRSADDIRRLRELVGGSVTGGRAKLPKQFDVRDQIHQAWAEITSQSAPGQSLRDWIFELHSRFAEYTIDSLYSTLKEFEDEDSLALPRRNAYPVGK